MMAPWLRSPVKPGIVSLASLRDHRKIAIIGARCNVCGHRRSWPIEDLIERHQPWTLASDLWKAVAVFKMRLARCAAFWGREVAVSPTHD
jgi:hypothetical protein